MIKLGGSGNKSSNESWMNQGVWGPQGNALGDVYNQAGNTFQQGQGLNQPFQQFGMNQVNPFMMGLNPYMMGGWGNQMGGGQQGQFAQEMDPTLQASLKGSLSGPTNTSKMYQSIIGGPGNTYIDPMVDAMYKDSQRQTNQGLGRINQSAAMHGQSGSDMHGIERGLLQAEGNRNADTLATNLRGSAYDRDLQMKMGIAEQADSNRLATQQMLMDNMSGGDANQQWGVNQGNNMQQFGMGMMNPWMAMQQFPWMNTMNYSNVVGDPTVLSSGGSKGSSAGGSAGFGFG